ncbi:MAG: ATP-binding cassette domain-containing protein [Brevundimonas sp.]
MSGGSRADTGTLNTREAVRRVSAKTLALPDSMARSPRISGGQKQRILLARTLYRQPRILVLDEATSHLDVARERTINAALSKMPVTRLVIAHRPETIAAADRVVALQGVRLIELKRAAVQEPVPA